MGNNCAFALVAGGGFRGPPPRLPVVIIESLLSLPLPPPRASPYPRVSSRVTWVSYDPRNALFSVPYVIIRCALA